jgi:hypothetical protein
MAHTPRLPDWPIIEGAGALSGEYVRIGAGGQLEPDGGEGGTPAGAAPGDLLVIGADGTATVLPIPADWATAGPYVLGIVAGVPAWRVAASDALAGLYPSTTLYPATTLYPEEGL